MFSSLHRFQRLLGSHPAAESDSRLLDEWAESRGYVAKRVRRSDGRVVEFDCIDGGAGRMEWGPSQRAYIRGRELRVRVEAGLPGSLEMLLMTRRLAEQLDSQAYETLVEGQQTGVNATLPEEVRWLSMLERVPVPSTAAAYLLLSSSPPHAQRWLDGELLSRVSRAAERWLGDTAPLVLMTLRGRIYLRLGVTALDESVLDGARGLTEVAAVAARHCLAKPTASAEAPRSMASSPAATPSWMDSKPFAQPSVLELPLDSELDEALGMPRA